MPSQRLTRVKLASWYVEPRVPQIYLLAGYAMAALLSLITKLKKVKNFQLTSKRTSKSLKSNPR